MVDESVMAEDSARYWELRSAVRAYKPMEESFEDGLRRELDLVTRLAVAIRTVIVHEMEFQQTLEGDSFDA